MKAILWQIFLVVSLVGQTLCAEKPNFVIIVADDLGWNDVSFHGSDQIPTPNIDKLAKEGIILNNYYVAPICSPSRSAIMTGRYPIHTGMQESTVFASDTWGVGLNETFLPEILKEQGYSTHAVGKWHVGMFAKEYTPTYRGFDSFYGYYLGKADYWDHSNNEKYWGLDLHDNLEPVWTQWGNYSTEMYTAEAEGRIHNHDQSKPLFLYLAYQAVHSANRDADALQAPDSWIRKYNHIQHEGRRKFAAMMGYMDYGIGRVHDALVKTGMINNTVIIFTTDNGGPANGFDQNWANNFPLRGVKATLWEGGVRAAGFVHSNLLKKPGRTSMDLIHITDWVPTLVNLAGGSSKAPFDGVDQWSCLSEGLPSAREEILLNIDNDRWMNKALRMGDWKIIQETGTWDGWYAPPGVIGMENTNLVDDTYITFQSQPVVNCGEKPANVSSTCFKKPNFCLFNIIDDPCEYHDLSGKYPELLETMKKRLQFYEDSAVPPRRNETGDPRANPKLHNGVWVPWITLP
uniref:Sulfatase N-terminal domain-containing protein n=1 Tax=Clytia hemisphaerica TaxID=252671 RepID=A0A7M5V5R4_9CNID